jgi:hypothetical protein
MTLEMGEQSTGCRYEQLPAHQWIKEKETLYEAGARQPLIPVQDAGTVDCVTILYPQRREPFDLEFYSDTTRSNAFLLPINLQRTSDLYPDVQMAQLETAAVSMDEQCFADICQQIDWDSRNAEEHSRVVRLALKAGAHPTARELARDGIQRYPQDAALQKMVRVLYPPAAEKIDRVSDSTIRENLDWFVHNSTSYRGKWVAVQSGRLLGSADTLEELKVIVPGWRQATLTRITW